MTIYKKGLIASVLILLTALCLGVYGFQYFVKQEVHLTEDHHIFSIQPGSHFAAVSHDLYSRGIITVNPKLFTLYARLTKQSHLIKAGDYQINHGTTLPQLIEQFTLGDVVQYSFTIVEGTTAQQLIDSVLADGRIVKTLKSNELVQVMDELGLANLHGEGQFAPETYHFTSMTTDKAILLRAHDLMNTILAQEWEKRSDSLPYSSSYEALIMASIIEKETGNAEERAEIAGVFVRRLKKGMRLQTDPTVIYGMGKEYNGNIRRKDLKTDTPYNTYTRSGLPPTPIALPSRESIIAALHPAEGKTLYFVAMGREGRHAFSETLEQHNAAVRKYQLRK
jgi:UPF0755 protein